MAAISDLDFRILGSLEVFHAGEQLRLGGAKQRAVLAILLVNANRVVTTDFLVEALWPDKPPGKPLTAIQGYVSSLRKILASDRPFDVIVTEPAGYRAPVDKGALDLLLFDALSADGRDALARQQPMEAARALSGALSLFRGAPLADFAYEDWAHVEIDRIEELRLACLEDRIEADLALGRHAELVGELEVLIAQHPLRERFRAQLMLALYRSGRQAEALDVYQSTRTALVEELGLEPGPGIQALHTQILNQDPGLAAPSRQTPQIVRLPTPATSFIGRERELADLTALIERRDVRLVTLTGPGGTGKTRLALKAAATASDGFPDGVVWVALAPLRDPALVTETISHVLGSKEGLPEHIGQRKLLILLDNLEQVIDAAPELSILLLSCPNLTLLVTSRELLSVQGEVEYAVPPLDEAEAVSLFCERAQLQASVEIAELCARLDFLPLAVELGAARTKALSVPQIHERLSQRLDLLRGGRDADPRQQTLRATMEWSYQLLTPKQQQLFARLSVFVGGCTLDAAEEVCGADLDTMQSLVEKSLLRFSAERYWMLETVREYAGERLDEIDGASEIRRRHALYFVARAEHLAAPLLAGIEEGPALSSFADDHDEYRGALAFLETFRDPDLFVRLAVALCSFWEIRGHLREGLAWLEVAVSMAPQVPEELKAGALQGAGVLACRMGEFERAIQLTEASAVLWEDLGVFEGRLRSLNILGIAASGQKDYARARQFQEDQAELAREAGAEKALATALHNLGAVAESSGDFATALRRYEESLVIDRERSDQSGIAQSLLAIGSVLVRDGRGREAREFLTQALELMLALEYMEGVAEALVAFAALAELEQAHETSATLLGAADALRQQVWAQPIDSGIGAWTMDTTRRSLGVEAFETLRRSGARMEPEAAAALALASND